MGRTMPTVTQVMIQEEQSFARFRRALRRSDQVALDDLFASAKKHIAAAQALAPHGANAADGGLRPPRLDAAHILPFEVFLLSMLLEEHKEVQRLKRFAEEMEAKMNGADQVGMFPESDG